MADDDFQPEDDLQGKQEYLYDIVGFNQDPLDSYVHDLFWNVMYNDELTYDQRVELYEQMAQYLAETYGIDFAELWDWEAFREWYDSV